MSTLSLSDAKSNYLSSSNQVKEAVNTPKSEPPNPYIMGGCTRTARIEIDTLVLNLKLSISEFGAGLFPRLRALKDHIQSSETKSEDIFEFGKGSKYFKFSLQRVGIKFYPYVLKCGDIVLMLSQRDENHPIPSARLHLGSVTCQDNVSGVYHDIKRWLQLYGLKVVSDDVSRVDLCHDFLLSITDDEVKIYDEDYSVFKARTTALYRQNRCITGLQFGKGDIVLRIYDKIKELQDPHSQHKAYFFHNKWLQKSKKPVLAVTRVEYQLRKSALNSLMQVTSFKELQKAIPKIWKYLTTDWFRHSSQKIDRENRHQDRAQLSYFWKTVQSIQCSIESAVRTLKKNKYRALQPLLDQTRGLLVTICAGLGHSPDDYFGMLATVREIASDQMANAMNDYELFRRKFECISNTYELTF